MSQSLSETVRNSIELKHLRHRAENFKSPMDREQAKSIMRRHDKFLTDELRTYRAEYQTRVNKVIERKLREAGSPVRKLTPRFGGSDRFAHEQISKAAQREVRDAHHKAIARIEHSEAKALRNLNREIASRSWAKDMAKSDFSRVVDRLSGQDRRRTPSRT